MKKILGFCAICVLIFSCREKEKVDIYYPELSNVKVNGVSASEHLIVAPSTMQITLNASDNIALNQAKVTITPVDFSNYQSTYGPNTGEWSFTQIVNIGGTASSPSFDIVLPDSIAGFFDLRVDVSDDAGYLATPYIGLLEIDNDNLPEITDISSTPAIGSDGVLHIPAATNLEFSATVFDADGLASVEMRIENLTGTVLDAISIPVDGTGVTGNPNFDDAESGYYMIVVEGVDLLGYRRAKGIHLIVD